MKKHQIKKLKPMKIYTDGSCPLATPGPGGWSAYIEFGKNDKTICGGKLNTDSYHMELYAIVKALEFLKYPSKIILYSDHQSIIQRLTSEKFIKAEKFPWDYTKSEEINYLWLRIFKRLKVHSVKFEWVKGHGDCFGNQEADKAARKAAEEIIFLNTIKTVEEIIYQPEYEKFDNELFRKNVYLYPKK